MGLREKTSLYVEALEQAILCCRPEVGLLIHSDHGSPYTSRAFRNVLKKYELQQSMGEVESYFHNAFAESWFEHLKREAMGDQRPANLKELEARLKVNIHGFYYAKLPHSALGYT